MTAGSDTDLNGDEEAHSRLIAAITQVSARAPQLAPLVFTPAAVPHPMSDAVEVFHHAAGQLLRRDNEHPLAFFGVHSMNRVTRSREAVGFLLTDRAIHVRDSPSGLFGEKVPRTVPLINAPDGVAASSAAAVSSAASTFEWKWADGVLTADSRSALLQALTEAVVLVLDHDSATANMLPSSAPATAGELRARVDELGLADVVKFPHDAKHRKHFVKLTKTFALPSEERIAFSITDQTFVGAYGLLATERALLSKDLMQPMVTTPWTSIDSNDVRLSGERIIATDAHLFPSYLAAPQRSALVVLIAEFSAGRLEW